MAPQYHAKYIAQKLLQNDSNGKFLIVEPNKTEHNEFKLTNYNKAVEQADIVAFLVAHDKFKDLELSDNKIMLDFCGIKKH